VLADDEVEMKERDETNGASSWDGTPPAKLSPIDVQQKEFRVARFGAGYRMREVDEFLDHVTDALTALIAENERLQRTAATRPAEPAVGGPAGDGDRAAVDAFLRSEKGFLQDLGALVQTHAEELKTMVRTARTAPAAVVPPDMAPASADTPDATAPDTAGVEADRPPADVEATSPPGASAPETSAEETPAEEAPVAGSFAAPAGEVEVAAEEREPVEDPDDRDAGGERVTGVVAEGPIRLEEPEPARSGRTDDDRDGLRELFWGEE
jgi:DivIVA domain-containing protein